MLHNSKEIARMLKVFSVDARVRILQLLKCKAMCVNALATHLNMTQGAVSQHLRIIRDAGLVTDEKHGYYVHYRLNKEVLALFREKLNELLDPYGNSVIQEDRKGIYVEKHKKRD